MSSDRAVSDRFVIRLQDASFVQELRSDSDRRLVVTALALMAVSQIWLGGAELLAPPAGITHSTARLLIRTIAICVCLFGAFSVHASWTVREYRRLVLNLSLSLALVWLMLNLLRPRGDTMPLRGPLIATLLLYGAMPNSLVDQFVPAALFGLGIIAERLFWLSSPGGWAAASDVAILILVNVVGVVMTYRRVRLEQHVDFAELARGRALEEARESLAELQQAMGPVDDSEHPYPAFRTRHQGGGAWA